LKDDRSIKKRGKKRDRNSLEGNPSSERSLMGKFNLLEKKVLGVAHLRKNQEETTKGIIERKKCQDSRKNCWPEENETPKGPEEKSRTTNPPRGEKS